MSVAMRKNQAPEPSPYFRILEQTLHAFELAVLAAENAAEAALEGSQRTLDRAKQLEEQLDTLDREINEGVTAAITQVTEVQGRELLGSLKFIIELERISDLLLSFVSRIGVVAARLEPLDAKDLSVMASLVQAMLRDSYEGYHGRDLNRAVAVLRADSELDRLRNLIFVRHIENPEGAPRQESFHVVIMSQTLERAGDHAKNCAEEVCQLLTGHSMRHLLRSYEKPFENMFVDWMRQRSAKKA
jgi:phosphate transport system protein